MEKKTKKKFDYKRLISGLVLFPVAAAILIFANDIVMSIAMAIVSIISLYEYYNCFRVGGKANPSMWYGMLVSILLIFIQLCSDTAIREVLIMIVPISILILMIEMIFSKGKKNIIDLIVTIFGICYIPLLILFISLVRARFTFGRVMVWYIFIAAWESDIFAYLIGKNFGKHHYTKISPGKTVEGCVAGIVGAIIMALAYTLVMNKIGIFQMMMTSSYNFQMSYIMVGVITGLLALIGQIGDLLASSIKRYCGIKDFSELIPGHGGMLDRIDSVIFIAPFAYILLGLLV